MTNWFPCNVQNTLEGSFFLSYTKLFYLVSKWWKIKKPIFVNPLLHVFSFGLLVFYVLVSSSLWLELLPLTYIWMLHMYTVITGWTNLKIQASCTSCHKYCANLTSGCLRNVLFEQDSSRKSHDFIISLEITDYRGWLLPPSSPLLNHSPSPLQHINKKEFSSLYSAPEEDPDCLLAPDLFSYRKSSPVRRAY